MNLENDSLLLDYQEMQVRAHTCSKPERELITNATAESNLASNGNATEILEEAESVIGYVILAVPSLIGTDHALEVVAIGEDPDCSNLARQAAQAVRVITLVDEYVTDPPGTFEEPECRLRFADFSVRQHQRKEATKNVRARIWAWLLRGNLGEQDLRDLLSLNLEVMLSASAQRLAAQVLLPRLDSDLAVRAAQLFKAVAAAGGNPELVQVVRWLNARLHTARRHDDTVLLDAAKELAGLKPASRRVPRST